MVARPSQPRGQRKTVGDVEGELAEARYARVPEIAADLERKRREGDLVEVDPRFPEIIGAEDPFEPIAERAPEELHLLAHLLLIDRIVVLPDDFQRRMVPVQI